MLEKFTVIDLIKTRSASVVTFTGNIVKFNIQTSNGLFVQDFVLGISYPVEYNESQH